MNRLIFKKWSICEDSFFFVSDNKVRRLFEFFN